MTLNEWIAVLGFQGGVLVMLFGLLKYLLSVIKLSEDRCTSELKQKTAAFDADTIELHKRVDNTHTRINDVREQYVRRDDFDIHINRIERQVERVSDEIRVMRNEVSTRIDILVVEFNKAAAIIAAARKGDL